ncbi:MAG: glycoside hydrolase family 13 protein [Eubacteriales bacterium]
MDFNRFLKAERENKGNSINREQLNIKGLFSDTTGDYVCPCEPNPYTQVKIKFRSLKDNIEQVYFVHNGNKAFMIKIDSDGEFDFYEHVLQLDNVKVSYYFEVHRGNETWYYDVRGVTHANEEYYNFVIKPGFKTPDWAKGAVFYQIYVDRFYNGDQDNDVLTNEYSYIGDKSVRVTDWNKYPATMGVREFYGGDLQGVLDKMDYLEELGIDAIYFNPLFVSPSNHKYDIQDYDYIDPHIGKIVYDEGALLEEGQSKNRYATRYINRVTNKANLEASNALFAKVVEEAHKRNIKVILDGVFNHCGSFNKWMDKERIYENADGYKKGAFLDAESPYRSYFQFFSQDKWPYNNSYDGWWGHDTLPKLNYEDSKALYDYILYIGKKWVSPPFNADGWRLDVAADLGHTSEFNHNFWKDFRKAVKSANPNAIILAEHYGNPGEWLQGDEWDTVMNYDAFMEPITWFLTGMQKHSDDFRQDMLGNAGSFWGAMRHHSTPFSNSSLHVAMNELSNHDHSRFLTRTNKKVGRINTLGPEAANQNVNLAVMREAVLMQMTWPGAPTIYYGDEAGVCGFTDPDNRRTYPWGNENHELIAFHKDMIRVHKENPEFKDGSIKYIIEEYNIVGYGRMKGKECSAIIINNNDFLVVREINVWDLGVPRDRQVTMKRTMFTTDQSYDFKDIEYPVNEGKVTITLPPTSGIILKYKPEKTKKFLHFI